MSACQGLLFRADELEATRIALSIVEVLQCGGELTLPPEQLARFVKYNESAVDALQTAYDAVQRLKKLFRPAAA